MIFINCYLIFSIKFFCANRMTPRSATSHLGLYCLPGHQGPVVQNFVILTSSLRHQLFSKSCRLHKQIHFFLLIKCENHSHIFSTKNYSVIVVFMFEILTNR